MNLQIPGYTATLENHCNLATKTTTFIYYKSALKGETTTDLHAQTATACRHHLRQHSTKPTTLDQTVSLFDSITIQYNQIGSVEIRGIASNQQLQFLAHFRKPPTRPDS